MYLSKTLPGLSGIRQRCDTHDAPEYLRVLQRPSTGKGGTILVRRRILDELNISFISLLDQMIDAVGIIFYLIFWGTNLGLGVHIMDARTALGFYDFCWEMSTVSQP
ncbi:hypothetical protein AAVH_06934 [Aphelenchoides avenae]|nr:hypothetical protein AAVH_06934 [Aphelenchus avenae]